MKKIKSDIRDIFFDNIKKKFLKNKKYFLLTNDADTYSLKSLRKSNRFIDAGVAEQNLINIASGLAKCDKNPIVYGFCTFLTFRCYEQLRFNIGSHNLNVKIIGIGPGYSFSNDGPTHHGIQDLYLMYLIPEMEVINIADNNLANLISKKIKSIKGPTYIRLDKGVQNVNQKIKYNLNDGFAFTIKKKIKTNLIISSGYFCNLANDIAKEEGNLSVINFFKFKNFNEVKFINNIKKYKKIIIYDENTISGGITPILMKLFNKYNLTKKIKVLASPDKQLFKYSLDRETLLKYLKINKSYLKKLI